MGQIFSDQKNNQLLVYSIDSLLNNFNPESKLIMKKMHFFKLMCILDIRLKKQGIDIKYPSYCYKFGYYSERRLLENMISNFINQYEVKEFIILHTPVKNNCNIESRDKSIIDRAVRDLYENSRYQNEYGLKAKKASYNLNSPYQFNTLFQEYISAVDLRVHCFFQERSS
jgi:hypothetical protein